MAADIGDRSLDSSRRAIAQRPASSNRRSWRRALSTFFAPLAWLVLTSGALVATPSGADEPTPSSTPATTQTPAPARIEQSLLLSYLADKSAFTLVDARSPEEFEASHVEGAINLPLERVAAKSPGLPAALDEPIVVYCKTGKRATAVAQALSALGYANVRVLPSEQLMFHDGLVIFNCSASGGQDGSG